MFVGDWPTSCCNANISLGRSALGCVAFWEWPSKVPSSHVQSFPSSLILHPRQLPYPYHYSLTLLPPYDSLSLPPYHSHISLLPSPPLPPYPSPPYLSPPDHCPNPYPFPPTTLSPSPCSCWLPSGRTDLHLWWAFLAPMIILTFVSVYVHVHCYCVVSECVLAHSSTHAIQYLW